MLKIKVNSTKQQQLKLIPQAELENLWQLGIKENSFTQRIKAFAEYFLTAKYEGLATSIAKPNPNSNSNPINDGNSINFKSASNAASANEFAELKDSSNVQQMLQKMTTIHELQISFNGFDCVTFVEIVFSLALAMHYKKKELFAALFLDNLLSLRYCQGIDVFLKRNHFMELDWIPNNNYLFRDITRKISKDAVIAKAKVNKLEWLKNHSLLAAYRKEENFSKLVEQAANASGLDFSPQSSELAYIPSEYFLNHQAQLSKLFPELSIVNIVRPGWDLTEKLGTQLNISHLGIVLKISGELQFYHASSITKEVTTVSLADYLVKYLTSETVKGINVLGCDW